MRRQKIGLLQQDVIKIIRLANSFNVNVNIVCDTITVREANKSRYDSIVGE